MQVCIDVVIVCCFCIFRNSFQIIRCPQAACKGIRTRLATATAAPTPTQIIFCLPAALRTVLLKLFTSSFLINSDWLTKLLKASFDAQALKPFSEKHFYQKNSFMEDGFVKNALSERALERKLVVLIKNKPPPARRVTSQAKPFNQLIRFMCERIRHSKHCFLHPSLTSLWMIAALELDVALLC